MSRKLNFEQAHAFLQSHPEATLIDVREEPEFITGHVANAQLLPVDEITEESAAEAAPEKELPVLVYCRTGRRSREAAQKLEQLGYSEVYDMGGVVGWPYGLE